MERGITFKLPSSIRVEISDAQVSGDRHGYGSGLQFIKRGGDGNEIARFSLDNYQVCMLRGFLGISE